MEWDLSDNVNKLERIVFSHNILRTLHVHGQSIVAVASSRSHVLLLLMTLVTVVLRLLGVVAELGRHLRIVSTRLVAVVVVAVVERHHAHATIPASPTALVEERAHCLVAKCLLIGLAFALPVRTDTLSAKFYTCFEFAS